MTGSGPIAGEGLKSGSFKRALVLGLGNVLLGDDGAGVRAAELFQTRCSHAGDVQVLDGGVLGLSLLPYLEGVSHLLLLDAVEIGALPGSIRRFAGCEIPAVLGTRLSPHQMGLVDLLWTSNLLSLDPEIVLWGIQPAVMEVGMELSSAVLMSLDPLVDATVGELLEWGFNVLSIGAQSRPRQDTVSEARVGDRIR